jgi:hypothetical protein
MQMVYSYIGVTYHSHLCICTSFNEAVTVSNDQMIANNELEWTWKEAIVAYFKDV